MNTRIISDWISKNRSNIFIMVIFFIYLVIGMYTEIRLVYKKPLPQYFMEDFRIYMRALSDIVSGEDPYRIQYIGSAYIYPPPALLFFTPLLTINSSLLKPAIYICINISLILVMARGLIHKFGHPDNYAIYLIGFWFGFAPTLELLHIGQINILTLFGIYLMFMYETEKPIISGFGLSIAILTKITPILFLGYLFLRKKYRSLVYTGIFLIIFGAITMALFGLYPFKQYFSIFRDLLSITPLGTQLHSFVGRIWHIGNGGLLGIGLPRPFLTWLAEITTALIGKVGIDLLQTLVRYFFLGIIGVSLMISLKKKTWEASFVLIGICMVFVSNIIWYHHYVFLLLPISVWVLTYTSDKKVLTIAAIFLLIVQADRWLLTEGLLIHVVSVAIVIIILFQQLSSDTNSSKTLVSIHNSTCIELDNAELS